ncbi:hypothetical protein KKE92_05690 [Candidatus Micrarchaeota archaeon]|nr:hypothetical protein [Candidatus Micrarchaeota archaeon]MBU1681236.1 hypothetical protein [Candidatus Micrarchaeota archaeon]
MDMDKILSIKNVPTGCMIIAALAITGGLSQPENLFIWLSVGGVSFVFGLITFALNYLIRKHEADQKLKTEKIKSKRQKDQSRHRETQLNKKLTAESQKTQREYLRRERAQMNIQSTNTDNAWKTIRGLFR